MDTRDPSSLDDDDDLLREQLRGRIGLLEEELAQHKKASEQIAQIVNDLNNLLAVMRGHAQLALEDSGKAATEELARIVLGSTARAQEVIKKALVQGAIKTEAAEILKDSVRMSRASILVVDDEEAIGLLMHGLLTKAGHDVTVVSSGKKAIEVSGKSVFDLVFLDIILGDLNGVEVFRHLRRLSPATRVVFLSGDPSIEEVRRTVRDEGADGFITKPFDIYELQNLVTYILKLNLESTPASSTVSGES